MKTFIEVDLEVFDTEDLIEELEQRGLLVGSKPQDYDPVLLRIYDAMKLNNKEEAWQLMQRYVCDKTGRLI